jgi:hypothetical protein
MVVVEENSSSEKKLGLLKTSRAYSPLAMGSLGKFTGL